MLSLCNGWEFTKNWTEAFLKGEGSFETVRLPHTTVETQLHYADPEDYVCVCGYRCRLPLTRDMADKRLFLQFDGAAHIATVYVNGRELAEHRSGYTGFRVEITDYVNLSAENTVAVKLDCTENPAIPPFGFVIDYLCYGGLYREAWMDVRPREYISDVFVMTPDLHTAEVRVQSEPAALQKTVRILRPDGTVAAETAGTGETFSLSVPDAEPWSADTPVLYTCRVLAGGDSVDTSFGFRTAEFRKDGFYLNGKKFFLRGLNRHQSYPYMGYAAPENLQRLDAKILKRELQCTAVRTSHYPQSQYFIDECDRQGLMVFTEIPGWQHVGDDAWQRQTCENVKEMVLQYRNHPSIILWGVRVNESTDNNALYRETNRIAHELDPSRATGGVRFIEQSSLLEDVYTFNDFSHNGTNAGIRPKKKVTPDPDKAFMITECAGHMFPTKSYDDRAHRQEHAMRHFRVQNEAAAAPEHAGCFGWCMFDYQTHRDFGASDRICYHGVLDMFRNPKLAAALYASQGEETPVLQPGSGMEIGDYPAGTIGTPMLFTNADSVKLYKNEYFVKELFPPKQKGMPHQPIPVDDIVGELLETKEHMPRKEAVLVRRCLLAADKYGLSNLPLRYKLQLGWAMLRYKLTMDDGVRLFGSYLRNWGGEATVWRFEGQKDGKTVSTAYCAPGHRLRLVVETDRTLLRETHSYDTAAVRIRVFDEYDNVAYYAQLPLLLTLEGDAELVGPAAVTAEGGAGGTYVRTTGKAGGAKLTVSAPGLEPVSVDFTIEKTEG